MDTYTNNLAFFDSKRIALELENFLADVEDLIAEATTMTGEELTEAKLKLNDRIESIKHSFDDLGGSLKHKVRRSAIMTNHYVHEQPWKAIGASTLAGFVVGYVFSRRC